MRFLQSSFMAAAVALSQTLFSSTTSIFVSATPLALTARGTPTTCNGYAELCSRTYGNVTYIGTHGSGFVSTTGLASSSSSMSSLADNQAKNVTQQLDDGVRMLQIQVHENGGVLHLCHSTCSLLDTGTLQNYLQSVKTWLDQNQDQVITILMVNSDSVSPSTFATVYQSVGLDSYAYKPPSATTQWDQWPTLGGMISNGSRAVVFMDYQADFGAVPWIIDEFGSAVEDAYDVTSNDWPCTANRTSGAPASSLIIHNHFLDLYESVFGINAFVPDVNAISTTNAASGTGSIGAGVANCQAVYPGRNPNFILLDFYDSNGIAPFQVANQLNGLPAPTQTIVSAETASASSSSSRVEASAQSTSLSSSAQDIKVQVTVIGAIMTCTALAATLSLFAF